jgi:hypothetical protein
MLAVYVALVRDDDDEKTGGPLVVLWVGFGLLVYGVWFGGCCALDGSRFIP